MSTYTITLGQLVKAEYELPLTASDYPIWDEDERDNVNNAIIDKYYYDEIGLETPDRFARRLGAVMREIMPKYNELARLQLGELQTKLTNTTTFAAGQQKQTTTRSGSETHTDSGTDTTKSKAADLQAQSDTPQSSLSLVIAADEESASLNGYASSFNKGASRGENETEYGKSTTVTYNNLKDEVIKEFPENDVTTVDSDLDMTEYLARARELIVNICEQIANDEKISNLFMKVIY